MLKVDRVEHWQNFLESTKTTGGIWADGLRRNSATSTLPPDFLAESKEIRDEVLYRVLYRGYLEREYRQIEKQKNVENIRIPATIDYMSIPGLRRESALKLQQFRPQNLGQAGRISGVNPADISILMVRIAAEQRRPDGQ